VSRLLRHGVFCTTQTLPCSLSLSDSPKRYTLRSYLLCSQVLPSFFRSYLLLGHTCPYRRSYLRKTYVSEKSQKRDVGFTSVFVFYSFGEKRSPKTFYLRGVSTFREFRGYLMSWQSLFLSWLTEHRISERFRRIII